MRPSGSGSGALRVVDAHGHTGSHDLGEADDGCQLVDLVVRDAQGDARVLLRLEGGHLGGELVDLDLQCGVLMVPGRDRVAETARAVHADHAIHRGRGARDEERPGDGEECAGHEIRPAHAARAREVHTPNATGDNVPVTARILIVDNYDSFVFNLARITIN